MERKLIFTSNDDGTLTVIADRGGDKFDVVQTLPTQQARGPCAGCEDAHGLYSAAKLGPPPTVTADNPNPTHHPTSLPGTFHVIVVRQGSEAHSCGLVCGRRRGKRITFRGWSVAR